MIDTFYTTVPRREGRNTTQIIGPGVQREVALRHEKGQDPNTISLRMRIPKAAVLDIIATYEHRARMFFKLSRRRG
jgi:hypothetical protein